MTQAQPVSQAPTRPRRPTLGIATKAKPAPAPIAPPARAVAPSMPQAFPLSRLRRAAENVRHTRVDEDCDQLATDIGHHGLLQSLIGYLDGDYVEVVGGGRRLKALRLVRDRGLIDDSFPVAVLIRDIDEAVELSLAENLQQKTMSAVDEFFAFAKLMESGTTSPADLAKRFGYTERVVKQRLRLAQLAKPVLDALADRQITLDAAMAYASCQDTALQVEVFDHQAKRGRKEHDPATVRHALRMKAIDTDDRLYRFVGADRYEREGGGYEDDLFAEAGKCRVLDQPFVLETLANSMVDLQAMRLVVNLAGDPAWSPTIAGFVKVPDLRLHAEGTAQTRLMRAPAGFTLLEKTDSAALWRAIRDHDLKAYVVVGIDVAGELIADPRYAFVPIGQKATIERPALVDQAAERERSVTAERERRILREARRLAVGPFAGTPFEGRAFWPDEASDRPRAAQRDGVDGLYVPVWVFVTHDQIAAQRKAATRTVDAAIAAPKAQGATA